MHDPVKRTALLLKVAGLALAGLALWSVVAPAKPIGASVRDFLEGWGAFALVLFVPEGMLRGALRLGGRIKRLTAVACDDAEALTTRET